MRIAFFVSTLALANYVDAIKLNDEDDSATVNEITDTLKYAEDVIKSTESLADNVSWLAKFYHCRVFGQL